MIRCRGKQFPLLLAALISFGCGSDGPSVTRESDPSLLQPVATSIGPNQSAEASEERKNPTSEDKLSTKSSPFGGSATVLLAADPTP